MARSKKYRLTDCVCCGRRGRHVGRGLIHLCYKRLQERGQLDLYPRLTRTGDDLLDRWELLVRQYKEHEWTYADYAAELGVTRDCLEQALVRARRRNDPRAVYHSS